MEILIFAIVVFVLAVYWMWRVRRGGSVDDPNRAIQGMPNDLREKNFQDFGEGPMYAEIRARPRVSRESGHGKDGGG